MDLNIVKSISESSNLINNWALSILGATLVAILSTSYIKPVGKFWKLIYLLYIPGWYFLYISLGANDSLNRRGLMAQIKPERLEEIIDKMNDDFYSQIQNFRYAVGCFCIWLILYLIWFIFNDIFDKTNKNYA